MKIALIYDMIYPFNVGGGEIRNYQFARELVRRGHEVHLFGAKLWRGEDVIEKDGLVMHGVYKSRHLYKKSKRSYTEPIVFSMKLLRPLLREEFDIIDCTAFPYFPAFTCKLYSLLKKKPLVLTWHEVWDDYWKYYIGWKGIIGRYIERILSRLTKNHIVVSERTKKRLKTINENIDIRIVPNALELDKINKVKPSKEEFDVMYCGRLLPHKNVDVLIRAVAVLKKDFSKIKCLVLGRGPEKEKLLALTAKLSLKKNIVFKDFVEEHEEVYSFMKSSKVFVLPSILEGFGIVVIEAMACGLPVITTSYKWNAAEDIIIENDSGYVLELSPDLIADNIRILLEDKTLRKDFRKNNKTKVKKYSLKKIVGKLEKFYHKIK